MGNEDAKLEPTDRMNERGARAQGLRFPGATGPDNAITDVPGVEVGYRTRIERGGICTGVTALFPCGRSGADRSVFAGRFALNGNGEMTGMHWIDEAGYFTGPVAITNSHGVGTAHHGLTRWMIRNVAAMRTHHHWYMPVVAETYDGFCNDINRLHLTEADVLAALDAASAGPVAQGNVGGGAGMCSYGFKGGTGTSSRTVLTDVGTYTVGVLVQANFGARPELQVLGVPVGALWPEEPAASVPSRGDTGSVIVLIATDAPLAPAQLRRLAKRGALGIGRTGSTGGVNSGDLMLAFSTANRRAWSGAEHYHGDPVKNLAYLEDNLTDPLHQATARATEEAVINAMLAAHEVRTFKPAGFIVPVMDAQRLREVIRNYDPAEYLLRENS